MATPSDSSRLARTTPNVRQEFFLSTCIEERADAAGTLPLNMYRRELTVEDRIRSVWNPVQLMTSYQNMILIPVTVRRVAPTEKMQMRVSW